jgi:hypothetical protein
MVGSGQGQESNSEGHADLGAVAGRPYFLDSLFPEGMS